ncbi:hypothetical protein YC2023_102289 [Brassica napus]
MCIRKIQWGLLEHEFLWNLIILIVERIFQIWKRSMTQISRHSVVHRISMPVEQELAGVIFFFGLSCSHSILTISLLCFSSSSSPLFRIRRRRYLWLLVGCSLPELFFSLGFMRACTCASLTFQLSLFTRMLCALGFRSLIFNRRCPSHPLNKRYAVLKVDGSSASLVSVNLDALSNLPPDCSLQPNHILCRILSMKRPLSDTPVPPVLVHRCLVASYPYVSTNDPSFVDKAFPTVDVLTCDKTIPPSSSIKHYKSSSAQSSSAV